MNGAHGRSEDTGVKLYVYTFSFLSVYKIKITQ